MAFDMNTAKPAQSGGFDITTAQPIKSEDGPTILEQIVGGAEGALSLTSGVPAAIIGGISGIGEALNPFAEEGAGGKQAERVQEALTFEPRTEQGKAAVNELGSTLGPLITGLQNIRELVGDDAFNKSGSPAFAALMSALPDATIELLTLGSVAPFKEALKSATKTTAKTVKSTAEALKPAAELTKKSFKRGVDEAFNFQTPFKKRIAEKIKEGSTDIDIAKFKLSPTGKAVKDEIAKQTITQGFDEGVIAAIKGASKADKQVFLKMVDVMEKGKKNKLFAAKNRPSDIAGDTLMSRFRTIRDANKVAGKELNEVAKGLKGQRVDINDAALGFADSLEDLGVTLTRGKDGKFKPDFSRSQLAPGDRGPIREVIRQMNIRGNGGIDAFDVHKMKRIIDNNVTFGKTNKGISGDAERSLKSFRRELDSALDSKFPEYNRVNTVFAETIGAIDAFQDVAGRKMNLTGPNADKATGTLLRRLMSNAQSRVRLIDSIDEIESVAAKHGGSTLPRIAGESAGKNDLLTQVLFVDELDAVFGPVARTSFQGQIDQAIKQGAKATTKSGIIDIGLDVAGKAIEKSRGINEEGAFKAIKALLKDSK